MDEFVTIIVPVYNRRAYLARCIGSIMGQTYAALQIILVDDGSTDGSGDVCDAFAQQDARIEVIHQANGGVSAARNAGLDRMRGAWIAFVDSDDYVSPYYIEDMFAAARDGCDIAICRYAKVQEGSDMYSGFRRTASVRHITGYQACVSRFSNEAMYNSCWGKLYRACLWEGLRYPEGKIAEDLYLSHVLLYRAGYIAVIDAVLYTYVQSGDSIMRSAFTSRRLDTLDAWQEGVHFYNAAGESELAHIARRIYCSRVLDARCICKKHIPHERKTLRLLRLRAAEAYREAKPIRGYPDRSPCKAFADRILFFVGRWCLPLYTFLLLCARKQWRMEI